MVTNSSNHAFDLKKKKTEMCQLIQKHKILIDSIWVPREKASLDQQS